MGARRLSAVTQLRKLLTLLAAAAAVQICIAGASLYAPEPNAAGEACSPGDAAGIAHLRDLNASQLAQNALNTSTLSTWDFGIGLDAVKAPAGAVALRGRRFLGAVLPVGPRSLTSYDLRQQAPP